MINLWQKSKPEGASKANIIDLWMENPHHQWIKNDRTIYRVFRLLADSITLKAESFFKAEKVLFLVSDGKFSSALSKTNENHVIIIYPELFKLIKSASPLHAVAILAHELGHIFHNHSYRKLGRLEAQLEADSFANSLGLGRELIDIIWEHSNDEEGMTRIQKLQQTLGSQSKL